MAARARLLVTGGTGTVGGAVVLAALGCRQPWFETVRVLSRDPLRQDQLSRRVLASEEQENLPAGTVISSVLATVSFTGMMMPPPKVLKHCTVVEYPGSRGSRRIN